MLEILLVVLMDVDVMVEASALALRRDVLGNGPRDVALGLTLNVLNHFACSLAWFESHAGHEGAEALE